MRGASAASVIADVVATWERAGAAPRPGAPASALAAFEARYGVRLPAVFRELYLRADGMESDDVMLSIWPLADVGPVPERVAGFRGAPDYGPIVETLAHAGSYFAFGDWMIWSHVYAARLDAAGGDGPVLWICGAEYIELAPSLAAFWALYLRDPDAVVFGQLD